MSALLREIKRIHSDAARTLERANIVTDSDIQSLTRDDLRDLFPEPKKFKLRKNLFEIIHKQKPVTLLLQEMREFIPHESFRAALTENGVLADYLKILKDMKTQVDQMQAFLEAHIDLLENSNKAEADHEPNRGASTSGTFGPVEPYKSRNIGYQSPNTYSQGQQGFLSGASTSGTFGPLEPCKSPNIGYQSPNTYPQVKCGMIVTGTTFDAHMQILDKVKTANNQNLELLCVNLEESPSNQDHSVIIVFCPISSRVGTDIDAAMRKVTGDKPVVLVLMHHTRDAKNAPSPRSCSDFPTLVLHVSVFYHDTMRGLLKCQENDEAVSEIQRKLLEYSITITNASGITRRMSADRSVYGGINKDSERNTYGTSFLKNLGLWSQ